MTRGRAILFGLLAAIAQVAVAAALAGVPTHLPHGDVKPGLSQFVNFDGVWYLSIVTDGYSLDASRDPRQQQMNVGFFPGYPWAAHLVRRAFGMSALLGMAATSLLACWGFWAYFLLLLRRWRVTEGWALAALAFLLAHPASFFLVMGYSESLFLFALLGFVYWCDADTWPSMLLALLHGFVMTATRLVGIPLVLYPLARWALRVGRGSGVRAALLAATSLSGAGAYLAFCHVEFGRWDLYFQTQKAGWEVKPDYLALGRVATYVPEWTRGWVEVQASPETTWDKVQHEIDAWLNPNYVSQATVPAFVVVFVLLALWEWLSARGGNDSWRGRLGYYLLAAMLFYLSASGLASVHYRSMIRYIFPVETLLVLAVVHHAMHREQPVGAIVKAIGAALVILSLFSLVLHAAYLHRFLNAVWVA
jgi:hypothetical protein